MSLDASVTFPASGLFTGMPDHLRLDALVLHAGVDLALLVLLLGVAYRRQRRDPEMILTLAALNVGLFATLVAISGDSFTTGAGFGLFGMLSLIRLRSASFTSIDMAYAFVSLVLGLILGLVSLPLLLSAAIGGLLVTGLLVGDHPRVNPGTQRFVVVLDRAHASPLSAKMDVASRFSLPVLSVSIDEVDFVRETTQVTVVCGAAPVSAPAYPTYPAVPAARRLPDATVLPAFDDARRPEPAGTAPGRHGTPAGRRVAREAGALGGAQ